MNTIRVGFIGFGAWTQKAYVPALKENRNVDIIAVAARKQQTHSIARAILGDTFESYTDYNKLLANPDIDAVLIGTPQITSAPAALAAVKARKHTFIEPPLDDSSTAKRLLKLLEKTDLVFHVYTEIRYLPILKSIKNITLNADFGSIENVKVQLENNWANEWSLNETGLIGMVAGLSPWYLDPIDFMFRRTPESVEITGAEKQVGLAKLNYSSKCKGVWSFNLHSDPELSLSLSINGINGHITADLITGTYNWTIGSDSGFANSKCTEPILGFVGMRESVNVFIDTIRGKGMTLSGPEVYRRLHKIIEALKQSQSKRAPVTI